MEKPVEALSQSYLRTKARTLAAYRKVMELHANSSNNTVYADADGHIAYFHPQFVPKRDDRFDWTRPVDGSDPATEWHGVHGDRRQPARRGSRPTAGSRTPTTGRTRPPESTVPSEKDFPAYMDDAGESPRGLHAIRVLEGQKDFTPERLRTRRSTVISRLSRGSCPAVGGVRLGAGRRSARGAGRRADRGAPRRGTSAGRRARCRRRSPCTGGTRSRRWCAPMPARPA